MLINLDELFKKENNKIEKQISLGWKTFQTSMGEFAVAEEEPVCLELVHLNKKLIHVSGRVSLVLTMACDRCLQDLSVPFSVEFQKEIDCNNLDTEDDSDDTQYIVDNSLDIDKIIRDEILIQWPAKVLCKDDCKGICKVCGHDLNVSDCGCDRVVLDPRMAAIQDIFNKANQ